SPPVPYTPRFRCGVQKIWVPAPRVAVFEVRARGESHLLLVSALPDETRIHRASGRPASPPTPLAFQGLLRAHLDPARLVALRALPAGRIGRMEFETPSGPLTLVAALLARPANLPRTVREDRPRARASCAWSSSRRRDRGPWWRNSWGGTETSSSSVRRIASSGSRSPPRPRRVRSAPG